MYIIDQEIGNEIASTQTLSTNWSTLIFGVTEEKADQLEQELRHVVENETDRLVAKAVSAYLPLYLEHDAITKYINKKRNPLLRWMMPEILSAEEAALMAQRDYMMSDEQKMLTVDQLEKIKARLQQKRN